ncbi:MAG: NUDIX domain-containing protein [Candidatus Omnitrophica bacterium]|nr:NUDIX domain-containing protein [Candidatus Omnitrophota bacterium]
MEKRIAAGGVVFRITDGKVKILLVKDKYGHWTWPKGHLERGETPEEGALREISEETGQTLTKIISRVGEQKYHYSLEEETIEKVVHLFLVESSEAVISLQEEELDAAEWLSPAEALERIEYEGSRELLRKALEEISRLG